MKNIEIPTVNDCLKIEPNKHSDTDLAWLTELADKFPAEELQTMYDSIKTRREKDDAELFVDKAVEKQIPISPQTKPIVALAVLNFRGTKIIVPFADKS